jgi:hypothetical protein
MADRLHARPAPATGTKLTGANRRGRDLTGFNAAGHISLSAWPK